MGNEKRHDVLILWEIVEVYSVNLSVDDRIMALKICLAVTVFR